MIRQARRWIDTHHVGKTKQEKDGLKRELLKRQKAYEALSNKFSKQYKNGKISFEEMEKLSKIAYADFSNWALSVGFYEEVSEIELIQEEEAEIIELIKNHNLRRAAVGLEEFQWPS